MAQFVPSTSPNAQNAASSPNNAVPLHLKAKRYQGTYRVVPKIEWLTLLAQEFGSPDWAKLYPLNVEKQELVTKGQLLSPRMACKLFHDGLYIIKKAEESPKFIQDRIPEVAHKCFKKKQWRKQFYESMRRVCCRLAIGLGFRPNCVAEDAFIHAILNMGYELGWRRIQEHLDELPEWERDRDFSKVLKFGVNEDVGNLLKQPSDGKPVDAAGKPGKKDLKVNVTAVDVKFGWFKCYDTSPVHMFDHIVKLDDEETDDWSVNTSSTSDSASRPRSDSVRSDISMDSEDGRPRGNSNPISPGRKARALSNLSATDENAAYFGGEGDAPVAQLSSLAVNN